MFPHTYNSPFYNKHSIVKETAVFHLFDTLQNIKYDETW